MKRLLLLVFAIFLSTSFSSIQAQSTSDGEAESLIGFARAITVVDDAIVIGEPDNPHQPGLVYVYHAEEGEWVEASKLSASDGEIGNGFGASLSADGNQMLVGAPSRDDERGGAYLFEKSGADSWEEVAKFALSDTSKKGVGASAVLHDDYVFLGAPGEDDGNGAVYVFKKSSSGDWTQQERLANPDSTNGLAFGSAMEKYGSKLIVGAPEEGGAAYVFKSGEEGSWEQEGILSSGQVADNAQFGSTLAKHNDKILVGAPREASGSGVVVAFEYNDDEEAWESSGRLVAYDSEPRYGFGSAIASVEGNVWIGAPGADDSKGALYQFESKDSGDEWVGVSKVAGPERKQGDEFASTIAVNNNIAAVGLTGTDYGAGKAAILELDDSKNWAVASTVISESGSVLEPITGNKVECSEGSASHFGCQNMNLLSFLPIEEIGGDRGVRVNDIWGWTDPETGKEYALVGRVNGTSFVDISDPSNPVYVADLPMTEGSRANTWRDVKVYKNHAYVVADNAGEHGIQVVDLTKLRDFDGSPMTLEEETVYDKVNSVHNIVINEDTGFGYAVGSSGGGQTCGGGLHMVDIQDPKNPEFAGCFADPSTGRSGTGYTHDAQCLTYEGPDEEHQGQEICLGANETAISIADVTDKDNPRALSTASYPDYAYVHQGWLTEDQRYFFQNDELDELTGNVDRTRTLIWDVSDLDDPQFVDEYLFDNSASDHNLYIKDNTMYQSNYVSGLQVVDISNPENPEKVGFFDTEPFGEDEPGFAGTWSNYPYFDSNVIIMTSSTEGLFILENPDTPVTPASAK
ncbi:MAG: choice-of-anchor B family protein [Bacteroidota bacterium]